MGMLFFILVCAAVGYYAHTLGRTFFGWMLASMVITPFLSSIILLILNQRNQK